MAKKSKSSQRWVTRQRKDQFVKAAAAGGLGSRAHFKLKEIDERFRLVNIKSQILELGAAPGGWTRYLAEKASQGRVVACDIKAISAPENVMFIEGAFGEAQVDEKIAQLVKDTPLDLVLSDMAPNISGIRIRDQALSMELVEIATDAARQWLKPGGSLLVKMFHGEGVEGWLKEARLHFQKVNLIKPKSSRSESREVFGLAQKLKA